VYGEVGIYEGGYGQQTGVYRPTFDSLMRHLNVPFYAVNLAAWTRALNRHKAPTVSSADVQGTVIVTVKYQGDEYEIIDVKKTDKIIPPLRTYTDLEQDIIYQVTSNEGEVVGQSYRLSNPRVFRGVFADPLENPNESGGHKPQILDEGYFSVRLPYTKDVRYLELMKMPRYTSASSDTFSSSSTERLVIRLDLAPI